MTLHCRATPSRYIETLLREIAEELLRCRLGASDMHQDTQLVSMLVNSSPEISRFALDGQQHYIKVPCVARLRMPPIQLVSILLPELPYPAPHGFIAQADASRSQQRYNIPKPERESEGSAKRYGQSLLGESETLYRREHCEVSSYPKYCTYSADVSNVVNNVTIPRPDICPA